MSHNSDFCFVQYNGYTKQEGVNNLRDLNLAVFKKRK
jgi:hypothetical protein